VKEEPRGTAIGTLLLLLLLGNKRYTALIFHRQFPFVLLVKIKDED
jgi:hypothetical protein